ncbi:MAG: PBP1A family penicillin-binding protein [Prochloraceae cyanobacterium]|nr:PBP1A family penicillin-binding protein [Prochloraceae cyanobacterium]
MSSTTLQKASEIIKSWLPGIKRFSIGTAKASGGTVLGVSMLASSIVGGGLLGLAISFRNLPDVRVLGSYVPSQTSYIYDVKGRLLARVHGEENRELVELSEISPELKRAVLAIEDSHFYNHAGVNFSSAGRALKVNLEKGQVVEGASTITMQLVKNLFLTRDRVYSRKLAEVVMAIRLEQVFSKDKILEIYLNNIYWGHNNYGIKTASQNYFNKHPRDLNLSEAAMMAGLIQAPERYSPFINYKETKRRQQTVLRRMRELGWISRSEEIAAFKAPLLVGKPTTWNYKEIPYVTQAVIEELNDRFGVENVQRGGLRVQITVDKDYQQMAEETVRKSHKRLRYWGIRADQIALVAVDPRTHYVKALVGGLDYSKSQFNRATQAKRQPGSSFKPFVYYTALASGKYQPDTEIEDEPVRYRVVSGYYEPKNYTKKHVGTTDVRRALMYSMNVPAVKVGKSVGLNRVIEVCRMLGIKSTLQPVLSLPLGSMEVTPLEMAGAYATFASNGWHSDPTLIVRVTDSQGNVLLNNIPKPKLLLNRWAVASLNDLLQDVVKSGTGTAAQIGRPVAGKTGTTEDERDVWFVGYVPQLATAVWIGNDNFQPIGRGATGGTHAAPIWRDFMIKALENEPVRYFPSASSYSRPLPSRY